ncbi:MAG: hypothetical protein JWM21_602 [Acidobacteria bacterium]|nr:hypothetical protein [Acidobacteriota bacterium]
MGFRVNFAARVQHALPEEGILVSDSVKTDYENRLGPDSGVSFVSMKRDLKSFGKQSFWRLDIKPLIEAVQSQKSARTQLLGSINQNSSNT